MKKFLASTILTFLTSALLPFKVTGNDKISCSKFNVDSILVSHQWTLMEMIQKENGETSNVTLLMMPCEKDNVLVYSKAGTYELMEGKIKCNATDENIKGRGSWEYDPGNATLVERYEAGSRIYKKVLLLNDEIFRIEYSGEGGKTITITYFSETGLTNDLNKDMAVDNSDLSQSIAQYIRDYLHSTNHYLLINSRDLQTGKPAAKNDINKAMPVVSVMPFETGPGTYRSAEKNKSISDIAKKAGVNYLITGSLIRAEARKTEKEYKGILKFQINILDVDNGQHSTRIFGNDEIKDKKGLKFPKIRVPGLDLSDIIPLLYYSRILTYKNVYQYYFLAAETSGLMRISYAAKNIFSNVNEAQRQKNFDSTMALTTAFAETSGDLEDYISGKVAVKIKINRIEGTGRNTTVMIEAGDNIYLRENEILKVGRIINTVIAGKTVTEIFEIGEIQVDRVAADILSYCSIKDKRDDILDAYKKNRDEIIVMTMRQPTEKKKGK